MQSEFCVSQAVCACTLFMLQVILQCQACNSRITNLLYSHPSVSALLIVWGTNHSYLWPAGSQHSVAKILSFN